jgi:alpha-N-arabinofuranosidase
MANGKRQTAINRQECLCQKGNIRSMSRSLRSLSLAALAGVSFSAFAQTTITLDLKQPGHKVSPMLYGLMTEEINHSYDGGLYAELIQNRAFKDVVGGNNNNANRTIPHWTGLGDAVISLDRTNPVSKALGTSLQIMGTKQTGVSNDGYWGIPVRPSTTYRASFYARAADTKPLEVSLESPDGSMVYAHGTAPVGKEWKKVEIQLETSRSTPVTTDARFVIRTSNGATWLSLVSLFPPTTNNRPNGTRPDLLNLLKDMKPSFLRFPGGNYVEGNTFKDRFDWKTTIGPLENRPGHMAP